MKRNKKKGRKEDRSDNKSTKKPKIHHGGGHGAMLDEGKNSGSGDTMLDPKVDVQANPTIGEGENPGSVDANLVKSPKVDVKADPKKVSVGHGVNVNGRHIKQLQSLVALMPAEIHSLKITNDKADVLDMRSSLIGVYLQWDKTDDRYFLWARTASERIPMKFEFHGGFTRSENLLEIKNPLLVFSESFGDNDHWRKVKQLLQELFGSLDEQSTTSEHDYVFAFTRIGMMFHFRVFKLLSNISSEMDNMKLQEVSPAFILKPVKIQDSAESMGVSINHMKNPFFDGERLMVENQNGLSLISRAVFYDKSCPAMIPHVMQLPHLCIVMLPSPENKSQLFEFNTSCKEFFERFNVSKKTHVPGTGADPNPFTKSVAKQKKKHKIQAGSTDPTQVPADPTPLANTAIEFEQITHAMRVFCRSLIKYAGDLFKEDACLGEFTEDNIFMRKGRLAIVDVELMEFTEKQAKENCNTIYYIINERIPVGVMPADVKAALNLLIHNDAVDKYELIVNNVAWMDALERNHMVSDLHEDFTEFLGADSQVNVTQNLEGMEQSEAKFKKNWLIYACNAYCLPVNATESDEGMQNYLKRKARELQTKPEDPALDVLKDPNLELALYTGRRYFGSIRHLYIHLSSTARKWKKMNGMTDEEKDLVVSSEFAATISSIQEHVPIAFKGTAHSKASYARFRRYFKNDEFDSFVEKQEVVA